MIKKSSDRHVNYDEVSHAYDQRYKDAYKPEGIASALVGLAREIGAEDILEAGCGTGHWLSVAQTTAARVYGLDCSLGMLAKAYERKGTYHLVRGDISHLPFQDSTFDIVYCVNALHHFDDPSGFIHDVRKLIRHGGALATVGMDPHAGRDRWYLYEYFPGTYKTDLDRYPSAGTVVDWMVAAGFENITWHVGERIVITRTRRDIVPLPKDSTSQLMLLTPQGYADGTARIEAALAEAEASGKTREFLTDISLAMITGWVTEKEEVKSASTV